MAPVRVEQDKHRFAQIDISEFRRTAARLLPDSHPLNRVLRHVPNLLDAWELAVRLDDFLALLSED
jgi:hypothetical protein